MSRNNGYNNPFDEDDDGEEIEITEEEAEASDDQGREEAATCVATGRSVHGRHRLDEEHRRMWFRMAKKALAVGAERRSEAEAAEQARVAAEEKAERERLAQEAKQQRHRERFERSMRESDERWERLNEQTRQENAAWEAGREERERHDREEAATARSVSPRRTSTSDGRPVQRPSAAMTATNVTTARPIIKPASPVTEAMSPPAPRSAAAPAQSASPMRGQTPRQPSVQIASPQHHRMEPERGVVAPQRAQPSRASAPSATAPGKPPQPALPTPVIPRTPSPRTPPQAPSAFTSPATAMLTGADLAAWRSARGLTQRPAADILGVAPSTVAKAELLPRKVLGEQLQVALAAALAR